MESYKSVNESFHNIINNIMNEGNIVYPRGFKTKEILGHSHVITNPRARLLTNEVRCTDIFYAIGELFWYLSGSQSLDFIKYYAPSMVKYSDDGRTLNSAYGYIIFEKYFDQFEECIRILSKDKESRQAIIEFRSPNDLLRITKDQVCTSDIQFFIRNDRLHTIVHMRSNDCTIGMIFDEFCFTMLQELMSIKLKVDLGHYYHIVNSIHIYEKWFEKCNMIMSAPLSTLDLSMKTMEFSFMVDPFDEICIVLNYEKLIRTTKCDASSVICKDTTALHFLYDEIIDNCNISDYWKDFLYVLLIKKFMLYNDKNGITKVLNKLDETNQLFALLVRRIKSEN